MKETKKKSQYESTKNYTKNYNKLNINVQLNREIIENLKLKLGSSVSIKSYLENLIRLNN